MVQNGNTVVLFVSHLLLMWPPACSARARVNFNLKSVNLYARRPWNLFVTCQGAYG